MRYTIHYVTKKNMPVGADIITDSVYVARSWVETMLSNPFYNRGQFCNMVSIRVVDNRENGIVFSTATYESENNKLINENTHDCLNII